MRISDRGSDRNGANLIVEDNVTVGDNLTVDSSISVSNNAILSRGVFCETANNFDGEVTENTLFVRLNPHVTTVQGRLSWLPAWIIRHNGLILPVMGFLRNSSSQISMYYTYTNDSALNPTAVRIRNNNLSRAIGNGERLRILLPD